ncbi:MAG: sigma-70 family RNA polymerase sigma factor [Phycisphaerae bacterium]
MSDLPVTTTLLLNSLKNEKDAAAWGAFDARYRRVIEDFARSAGLSHDDATEVAQQTLVDFVSAYRSGRYDRERGRLYSWIIGIAQHKVADCFRAMARGGRAAGGSMSFDLSDSTKVAEVFEQHMQKVIFAEAMERLRTEGQTDERTLKAFELVAIREATVEAAARECGMKPAEIYVAKHRVLARLRKIADEIRAAWEA